MRRRGPIEKIRQKNSDMISPNESEGHLEGFVSKDAEEAAQAAKVKDKVLVEKIERYLERDDAFLKWVLYGVGMVVVVVTLLGVAKVVLVEMHKTEQIRMMLELEKLRGTQMEKGTLGKKSAKKSEVNF